MKDAGLHFGRQREEILGTRVAGDHPRSLGPRQGGVGGEGRRREEILGTRVAGDFHIMMATSHFLPRVSVD